MIDLTPLDVRNKRGDFKRLMRGYDPQEVDVFLELVAERLEGLVRENIQLRERTQTLQQQVASQLGREQAVQDALVTAQELRADIKAQSQREAEHVVRAAETEARRLIGEAEAEARSKVRGVERQIDGAKDTLVDLERRRARFLKEFRQLLERELDVVDVEERRAPLEERAIDMELGPTRRAAREAPSPAAAAPVEAPIPAETPIEEVSEEETPRDDESEGVARVEASRAAPPEAAAPAAPSAPPAAPQAAGTSPSKPAVKRPAQAEGSEEAPRPKRGSGTSAARGPQAAAPAPDVGNADLAVSFEAEAVAEAHSRVVEVKPTEGDDLHAVPRLEEVLAEAGAELAEASPQDGTPRRDLQEIAPPPIRGRADETLLLYLDSDDKE